MLPKLIPIVVKMKVTISLFVIFSCSVLIVCCASDEQEFNIINKGLESYSNIISIYIKEFTSANFSRLVNTVNEFNNLMADYLGAAGKHLSRLHALNNSTKNAYNECNKLIYGSCDLITTACRIIANHERLLKSAEAVEERWNFTVGTSYMAAKEANLSLTSLKYLRQNATELKKILDAALIDINKDFGPEGFYVKNNQLSGRVILKKRSLCKNINTARAILDRFDNMDVDLEFYEDMNNMNAFIELYKLYDETGQILLMGNASLRNEIGSKYRNVAKQKCEYITWYLPLPSTDKAWKCGAETSQNPNNVILCGTIRADTQYNIIRKVST